MRGNAVPEATRPGQLVKRSWLAVTCREIKSACSHLRCSGKPTAEL